MPHRRTAAGRLSSLAPRAARRITTIQRYTLVLPCPVDVLDDEVNVSAGKGQLSEAGLSGQFDSRWLQRLVAVDLRISLRVRGTVTCDGGIAGGLSLVVQRVKRPVIRDAFQLVLPAL